MTALDSLSFSYKDVLLLRRTLSVLELAAAVQHSWSFSMYTKHLEVRTGAEVRRRSFNGASHFTHEAVEDVVLESRGSVLWKKYIFYCPMGSHLWTVP